MNQTIQECKCILKVAPPVRSFHAWHRGFTKLIGRL